MIWLILSFQNDPKWRPRDILRRTFPNLQKTQFLNNTPWFLHVLCAASWFLAADFSSEIITQKKIQEQVTRTHDFYHLGVFKSNPERAPKAIENRTGHHSGTNMGAKVAQEPVWALFLNILGLFLKHVGPLWAQVSDPHASRWLRNPF